MKLFTFYSVVKDGWCMLFGERTQPGSLYPLYTETFYMETLRLSPPRRNPDRNSLSTFILQNKYLINKAKYR